jgi:SecD/SecF fusion protein
MEKKKNWQLFLILAVIALTIYNILPTVFYYCKPLKSPIEENQAGKIALSIEKRVNHLESDAKDWIHSFCTSLSISPQSIVLNGQNLTVSFTKSEDANKFKKFFPRAGSLISFTPAQLRLGPNQNNPKEVLVQRRIATQLDQSLFSFAQKNSPEYREIIIDRAAQIAYILEAKDDAALVPFGANSLKEQLKSKDTLVIGKKNPIFSALTIDWTNDQILLTLHPDAAQAKQPLINEMAKINRFTGETVIQANGKLSISLHDLSAFSGFLVVDLEKLASHQAKKTEALLQDKWVPNHPDLKNLKVVSLSGYEALSQEEKALSLIVHADARLCVVAHGLDSILQNYQQFPNSEPAQVFTKDFTNLAELLQQNGFQFYRAPSGDLVFEKADLYHSLLAATREDFKVKGTRKWATLELSNVEQRLLTDNKIDTQIHEDLVKWKDEYNAAQVSIHPGARFDVPKPTKSVFLSNLALTMTKMKRGDERKVIRWGLDLSGGKTVQIELRDANNQIVKNDADLKQGINELYNRVNKMGVSEVAIRQLGSQIVLDFPGSQSLSASELIKASSMYFHVVNEKFSSPYSPFAASVNQFLMEVWNEAIVTNKKDSQSINEIAFRHLHAETVSEAARILLNNGLALQSTEDAAPSSQIDDTTCKIALLRGDEWFGQMHPLLIVFRNFALEGSQLTSIHPGYDPQKGNYLSFEVQSSTQNKEGVNPRENLYNWTSRYSKEKVLGTALEDFSKGRGWRMAVLLNDTVINAPTLDGVLKDSASISGSFSQREVNQLAADLKAGSLTFMPHILSEKNVSPELGQKDRIQGITATFVALLLVMGSMLAYYRFAGLVASVAVLFNLLILWATLQNIGATLSLAGIAGIILTIGMAVDANVLVFERIKEEFAISGKIKSAIKAGYEKAYSAIIDSNVTTIIAALILLNFDAGPIKGFAITLIIGIVSSMFTALFMTRFYFARWVQNPKNTALSMANWIQAKSIDFLKHTKLAFIATSLIILVGSYLIYHERASIFGMDFTGGYSLHIEIEPSKEGNYLAAVDGALKEKGIAKSDFQIRELNPSNNLRILFGTSMEELGKPFNGMPLEINQKNAKYPFETNPRIQWVVDALVANGVHLTESSLLRLEKDWTAMSGQMSDSMRNNALIGLLISFICIFIYIAFRFEYKFAAASVLCLIHDVLITLGAIGLLKSFGVAIQIDLNTVAAIMTIVGYSLNDTIIVFDRIREEMHLTRNKPLSYIVNNALNATLSRTTITSGTTLLVLIALVALGGSSIFSFALVMTIGVFFGTLSSWYIASPLMLFFHGQEEKALVKQS